MLFCRKKSCKDGKNTNYGSCRLKEVSVKHKEMKGFNEKNAKEKKKMKTDGKILYLWVHVQPKPHPIPKRTCYEF